MFMERMETVNVCRVEEVKNKEIHLSRQLVDEQRRPLLSWVRLEMNGITFRPFFERVCPDTTLHARMIDPYR